MSTRKLQLPHAAPMSFILLAAQTIFALPAFAQEVHHFDVSAPSSTVAIQSFGRQSGVQILASADVVAGKHLNAVSGDLTTDAAFQQLLAGTGLTARYVGDRSVALVADSQSNGAGAQSNTPAGADAKAKEGKKDSSGAFRVAQAAPGQAQGNATVDQPEEQASKKKPILIEEIIVTGSRIPTRGKEDAQDVKVYTLESIEQSGQTNVADFLNTLPSVSIATVPSGIQTAYGGTTVQLRGLPIGKTLVLINGRRVETSGLQAGQDFFDLNNIPLVAVDRIEVVADGSSAIYGSDAIGGVVNLIFKRHIDGFEASAKYGAAADIHESDASLAWGKHWGRGSLSIIGSYQAGSELTAGSRRLTASEDYTAFGAPNNNLPLCHPGNVFSVNGAPLPGAPPGSNATFAAVSSNVASGRPSFANFTYGILNNCYAFGSSDIIPATRRTGILGQGSFQLTPSAELFTELLYSRVQEYRELGPQYLFGVPGFQSYTVSASNPYNVFGTTVGISDLMGSIRQGQFAYTDFVRALVGARGSLFGAWQWELSAWDSQDSTDQPNPNVIVNKTAFQNALNSSDPATALNPFVAGPQGAQSLLASFYTASLTKFLGQSQAISGFARGPVLQLPSGPVEAVVGSEYDRDKLYSNVISSAFQLLGPSTFRRNRYAAFTEVKVPLVANRSDPDVGDTLALSAAARYDHSSDFGSTTTPQFTVGWRPFRELLMRGTYAKAFKAPSLYNLYTPQAAFQTIVKDPINGQTVQVTQTYGGNPVLRPEKGRSYTLGAVYSSAAIRGLEVSITNWHVNETNTIQNLGGLYILDNPNLFPGRVIRNPNGTLSEIIGTAVNFGDYDLAGVDYELHYRHSTTLGAWTPSLSVSQTYRYSAGLLPGTPSIDRTSNASDDLNWAPRWKGTAALGWTFGRYTANFDGRYVGKYRDYDPLLNGTYLTLGNFWLCDANFRYSVGRSFASKDQWLKDLYIDIGGVNLLNSTPQFSNLGSGFVGYDPTQIDIRGRFLYLRLGGKL